MKISPRCGALFSKFKMLIIKHFTGKGRGVYSDLPIREGDIVEVCPIILLEKQEVESVKKTLVYDYTFDWDEKTGTECLPLGYGMIYNHSADPNIEWDTDPENETVVFTALRDIPAGEELCHNYWPGQTVVFTDGKWREELEYRSLI